MKVESIVSTTAPNFIGNLTGRHSNLTEWEIKICMLTLLKRDAGEIAELMGMKDTHAVHAATSRLREKLGSEEEPLVVYLLKIANAKPPSKTAVGG